MNSYTWLFASLFLVLSVSNIHAAENTGRPVRVVSLSFYGNNISEILKIVDQEGARGTDLIVLPETWRGDQLLETIDGESITELSKLAKKHNTYIISPIERKEGYHHYNTAVLIDITGQRILDDKSENITISRITLDLDRPLFHENFNMDKLAELLKAHGDEIELELSMPREQWFVLKCKKPGVSARDLAKKFGMEELSDYQNRSRTEIDKRRGYSFTQKTKK